MGFHKNVYQIVNKKMRVTIAILALLCCVQFSKAQYAHFGRSGTISFDKIMYAKNIVAKQFIEKADDRSRGQFQQMLPSIPENITLKKTLKFNAQETSFEPQKGGDLDPRVKQLVMMFALDFDAQTLSTFSDRSYKRFNDIIGDKVIIQDTMKTMTWRITDEYREIAGYSCRRANGITPDSIYVVAYYAAEIPVSGGPESINGLPGMILGLAVPSQHVSYFATKVELTDQVVIDKKVFDNKKTKVMSRSQIAELFKSTMSNWLNKQTIEYITELSLL